MNVFKKVGKVFVKSFLWIIAVILGLLLVVTILIQIPAVQEKVTGYTEDFISSKTETHVSIDKIAFTFPFSVVVKGAFFEDQQGDTLLYARRLKADINLFSLFNSTFNISKVSLLGTDFHISRPIGGDFSFQFFIDAFADTSSRKKSGGGFDFKIGKVQVNDLNFIMNDRQSGIALKSSIGGFNTGFKEFDVNQQMYVVGNVIIQNSYIDLNQFAGAKSSGKTSQNKSTALPKVGFRLIELKNVHFSYQDDINGLSLRSMINFSEVFSKDIDLNNQVIALKELSVARGYVYIVQQSVPKDSLKAQGEPTDKWIVKVNDFDLSNSFFSYSKDGTPLLVQGFDPNHLLVSDISVDVKNLDFRTDTVTALINDISFSEKSGFVLNKLKGKVFYGPNRIAVKDFVLKTPGSELKRDVSVAFNDINDFKNHPEKFKLKVELSNSYFLVNELAYFVPEIKKNEYFNANRNKTFHLNTKINGSLKDLNIPLVTIQSNETFVDLSGEIKNVLKPDSAYFRIDVKKFSTNKGELLALLPANTLPVGYRIPEDISLTGYFNGTLKVFDGSFDLKTNKGDVIASVNMNQHDVVTYDAEVKAKDFDLGYVIGNKNLGKISFNGSINGSGITSKNVDAKVNLSVDYFTANGYVYDSTIVKGSIAGNHIVADVVMEDENLAFNLDADLNISKESPLYKIKMDLKGADLHKMNFYPEDLRVKGIVETNISGTTINDLNGEINIYNVLFVKGEKKYPIDSLFFASVSNDENIEMTVESGVIAASLKGNIKPLNIADAVNHHLSHYFDFHPAKRPPGHQEEEDFEFSLRINEPDLFTEIFFPKISTLPVEARGSFDSKEHLLDLYMLVPYASYGSNKIDTGEVKISSDSSSLQYSLRVTEFSNSQMRVEKMLVSGVADNDTATLTIDIANKIDENKLYLESYFASVPGGYTYKLSDTVKFQQTSWLPDPDNRLFLSKNKIKATDFAISHGNEEVSLVSENTLKLDLKDFDLKYLAAIVSRDTLLAGGVVNGSVKFGETTGELYHVDTHIENFNFLSDTVGNIQADVAGQKGGRIDLSLKADKRNNDWKIEGFMDPEKDAESLHLNADLRKLNMSSIEAFTMGQIKNASGDVNGQIEIKGSLENPQMDGFIKFYHAEFSLGLFGTSFRILNEQLDVEQNSFIFRDFKVYDTLFHPATINGFLCSYDMKEITFDLHVVTENFLALNTVPGKNDIYYGRVFVDSRISLRGSTISPIVDATAKLKDGSNLTVINPQPKLELDLYEGIVEFIDTTKHLHPIMQVNVARPAIVYTPITGMELNANIEVDDKTTLKIIVDQTAGDSLVVKGNTTFNLAIDKSDKISLTGGYEITEGSYALSFNNFIKKRFTVQKGSTITWAGDPLDADIDITAVYTVRASTYELVGNEVSDDATIDRDDLRQSLPFNVLLVMQGALLKPDIGFKIDLPVDEQGALGGQVYAKLNQLNQQDSELNEQVFSLLMFNRFKSSNMFSSGSTATSLVRTSASKLLSQQLNSMASNYIPVVDLNLSIDSYEDLTPDGTQGRTQLIMEASRDDLLNDRIAFRVGGNYDLESSSRTGENFRSNGSSFTDLATDAIIEYKLTDDGRYRLKALRKNSYLGVFDGQVTENAFGLVFTRDYNRFRDLFRKPREVEKLRESNLSNN